jgi:hypothetical protein
MELIVNMHLREVEPLVLLLLHIDDIFDEVLDIEESGEIDVFGTHREELLGLDDHQLVLGHEGEEVASLAGVRGLDTGCCLFRGEHEIVYLLKSNLEGASLGQLGKFLS